MISPKATNKPAKTTCRVDARTIIFSPYLTSAPWTARTLEKGSRGSKTAA